MDGSSRLSLRRTLSSGVGYAALLAVVFSSAAFAVYAPLIFFGGVAAIGFVALAWTHPKAALALTLIATILSGQLQAALGAVGGVAEEAMIFAAAAVIVARRALVERSIVWLPGSGWFAVFVFAGVLGAILYGTPIEIALQGATLLTKCIVIAIAIAQVHWSPADLHRLARAGFALAIFVIVTGIVNLAIPGLWTATFGGSAPQYFGGLPAIIGPFSQPAAYGRMATILASSILVYQLFVKSSWFGYATAVMLGLLSLLTFRAKALVGLLVVGTGLVLRKGNVIVLVIAAGFLPAVLALIGPGIAEAVFGDLELYYGGDMLSGRARLTAGGVQIATQHFPLGVGLGRYASATAADYYSPEYTRLGFTHIYGIGVGPEMGQYLNDTQWPALLGETGVLGTIAFIVGAALALRILFSRVSPDEPPIVRWIRLSGVCWFTLIMLDSVAAPAFSSPPSYVFLFAASAIVASIRTDLRTRTLDFAPQEPRTRRRRSPGKQCSSSAGSALLVRSAVSPSRLTTSGNSRAPSERDTMNLLSFGRALRRGWIWVLLILIAALAGGWLVTKSIPPQYESSSRVLYSLNAQGSLQSQVQANSLAAQRAATDAQLIPTPTILTPALAALNDPDLTLEMVTDGTAVTALAQETLVDITVILSDPDQAAALNNAIIEVLKTRATASTIVVDPTDPASLVYTFDVAPVIPPVVPDQPSSPNLVINILIAFAVGVLAAVIFLAIQSSRDKRIYDLETLRASSDLPIVGSLAIRGGDRKATPREADVATLREAILARNPKGGTWLLTSAGDVVPTGVARSLASSTAAIGRSVTLLVTGAGSPDAPGLSDFLAGNAAVDDVRDTTTVSGVSYVGPGTLSGSAADALASSGAADALRALTDDSDIVFVSAAPADRSADASVLARMGLHTLVLVRGGRTTTPQLSRALSALTEAGGVITGLVFTTKYV